MKFKTLAVLFTAFLFSPIARAGETQTAVFAAGCFWCVEAIYEQQPGVVKVVSGYAGGEKENPTYEEVSSGRTGHFEAVMVYFDPEKTSFRKLVDYFWKTHDPTNGKGVWPDFGPQYRSAILTVGPEQAKETEASKSDAQSKFDKPIATVVKPLKKFYPAEEYHQDYVRRNPNESYVRNVSIPRLRELGLKPPGS